MSFNLVEQLGLSPNLPQVDMELVGADGNAFAILGRFKREARKQGWDAESITKVTNHAMAGDYNNLLATLIPFVNDISEDEEDEFSDYDENDGYDVDEYGYSL